MLQPDAFCQHTIQQNATTAGLRPRQEPRTPLGKLTAPPDPLWFKAVALRRGREGEMGRGGAEGQGKRGEVQEGMGSGGEGSWNRAPNWLRPALIVWKVC